jgi:hypothetical protein
MGQVSIGFTKAVISRIISGFIKGLDYLAVSVVHPSSESWSAKEAPIFAQNVNTC